MAKFAQLFPWLRDLFPPSEARGFQPSEVSEDVSLVHQVHQGTDLLDKALSHNLTSVAGTAFIETPEVDTGFFWYVLACGVKTNDATARLLTISLAGTTTWPLASTRTAYANNQAHAVPRAFIVPPFQKIRGEANAIGGGQSVILRVLYFKIALGLPAPPSP